MYNKRSTNRQLRNLVRGVNAGFKVYDAARRVAKNYNQTVVRSRTSNKRATRTYTASYAGRFPRPKRNYQKSMSKMLASGFGREKTTSGSISDDRAIYIGHNSFSPRAFLYYVALGMIRKLVKQVLQVEVLDEFGVFPTGVNDQNLQLEWSDGDGTAIQTNLAIALDVTTINDAAQWLQGQFINGINLKAFRTYRFLKIYGRIDASPAPLVERGGIAMTNMYVNYWQTSVLKIQNTSIVSDGDFTAASVEDVHNVPLQGLIYKGKGNVTNSRTAANAAIIKSTFLKPFEADANSGLMLYNRGTGAVPQQLWNPPQPQSMENTFAGNFVRLQPGKIRKDTISFKVYSSFNSFLDKIVKSDALIDTGSNRTHTSIGHFHMFGLTKQIRATTDKVKCVYEIYQRVCCNITMGKPEQSVCIGEHTTSNYLN